jgi:peptidoglycan/LPS O-acetylase OafA/YrhL
VIHVGNAQSSRRPHVYELDLLRAVTALAVIAVHTLSFTVGLNQTEGGMEVQNAVVTTLHFTREVFMFVTAFALVYVYYGRPFKHKNFWYKRGIGVLMPYVAWTLIYTWFDAPSQTPLNFVRTSLLNILSGNAAFQLYYILLTIQLYILLPVFLALLKRVMHHPWRTLIISFIVQLVILYADYQLFRVGTWGTTPVGKFIVQYQDRFILFYQFFFVLGGLTALYLPQVRAMMLRYSRWIIGSGVLGLVALLMNYVIQVRVLQEPAGLATVVLQPIVAIYSLTFIIFAFWAAFRWARHTDEEGHPPRHRLWQTLSDASFGIYLIHALFLVLLLRWLVPIMPVAWPVALRVFILWFLTAGGSLLSCLVLLRIPILSRLIGRSGPPLRRKTVSPTKGDAARAHGQALGEGPATREDTGRVGVMASDPGR